MKILHLMRHAKSDWDNPQLKDIDRPLSKRGKSDLQLMGQIIPTKITKPQIIIASPARRAADTAQGIAAFLDMPVKFDKLIYDASPTQLLKVIHNIDDSFHSAMLVGHNPTFTDLANGLGDKIISNLPTCALYSIQFKTDHWQEIGKITGHCLLFDRPKNHK